MARRREPPIHRFPELLIEGGFPRFQKRTSSESKFLVVLFVSSQFSMFWSLWRLLRKSPPQVPGTRRWPGPRNSRLSATHPTHPFSCPVVTYFAGYMPSAIAIADVNGDGISDLVLADTYEALSGSGVGGVSVLLGNGDGNFGAAATYSSGGDSPQSIAIADLNGDGRPDIVVGKIQSQTTVAVLLGNGDGTFQPAVTYGSGGSYASSVALADVNGDGRPDIVVTNFYSSTVAVLLGNGDGTFQPAVNYASGGVYASSVVLADVNGDGRPDIVVANECDRLRCSHGMVGVLVGNGDGSFKPATAYSSDGWSFAGNSILAVADVNGDSKPDLLVANGCANSTVARTPQ